jgi:hypothetical protein
VIYVDHVCTLWHHVRIGLFISLVHKMPDFPFGKREIRWLLVRRGIRGTVGVSGFIVGLVHSRYCMSASSCGLLSHNVI